MGEQTDMMLEKLLLRLNEQGLEVSSPLVVNQEQLSVEVLGPRLHQALREKERWENVVNWIQQFRITGMMPNCACKHVEN